MDGYAETTAEMELQSSASAGAHGNEHDLLLRELSNSRVHMKQEPEQKPARTSWQDSEDLQVTTGDYNYFVHSYFWF